MKIIGVFLGKPDLVTYFETDPYHQQGYFELAEAIRAEGGELVLLGSQESYKGLGVFDTHWKIVNHQVILSGKIQVDVIYDKNTFQSDDKVAVLNPPFINQVCINKWLTYELFEQYCPKTIVVESVNDIQKALTQIPSETVVVKPVDGSEGKDVSVMNKSDVLKDSIEYPILLQEFLDSSAGIPLVMTGIHDLRVAILNGEILFSFYRTPPEGSLIANVARGGKQVDVPKNLLPQQVVDLVQEVDKKFNSYPNRYYSVDVAFTPQGIKIIELNSRLGLSLYSDGEVFRETNQALAKVLMSMG